ncbi:hypothetical protein COL27_28270, partial [Bacillus sp. AFS075960]
LNDRPGLQQAHDQISEIDGKDRPHRQQEVGQKSAEYVEIDQDQRDDGRNHEERDVRSNAGLIPVSHGHQAGDRDDRETEPPRERIEKVCK